VPQFGAVSYLLGVHLTAPTKAAGLSVGSFDPGAPLVPTVEGTKAGDKRSGVTAVAADSAGRVRFTLAFGTATVLIDVDGYYVG
jgi:hypothetical protein